MVSFSREDSGEGALAPISRGTQRGYLDAHRDGKDYEK
jgi:hypothetical protein